MQQTGIMTYHRGYVQLLILASKTKPNRALIPWLSVTSKNWFIVPAWCMAIRLEKPFPVEYQIGWECVACWFVQSVSRWLTLEEFLHFRLSVIVNIQHSAVSSYKIELWQLGSWSRLTWLVTCNWHHSWMLMAISFWSFIGWVCPPLALTRAHQTSGFFVV